MEFPVWIFFCSSVWEQRGNVKKTNKFVQVFGEIRSLNKMETVTLSVNPLGKY